jgi:hypothetical protein
VCLTTTIQCIIGLIKWMLQFDDGRVRLGSAPPRELVLITSLPLSESASLYMVDDGKRWTILTDARGNRSNLLAVDVL